MDPPSNEVRPATLEEVLEGGPSYHCDLCDNEIVHKIAQALLPGLASACVDNTLGGLFRNPASVAVDIRREMVDYLSQRSENFVAESVVFEGGADPEVPDHPYDIINDFVEDFSSSKRNIFSRVSGWLLSERREDRIDDFVQEMEVNGFWLLGRREAVAQTLLKNVDFKNTYHCDMKFSTSDELANHVHNCGFRITECNNEGCDSRFSAAQTEYHDSVCPFKILPCEQNCSESLMRREMDRHCITVCPMKLVNCPFYPSGCLSLIPKSTIDEHRSENLRSHLVCVLKALHRDASVKSLEKRAEDIEKLASPGRLALARDARSLTYAIKDFEAKLGPLEIIEEEDDNVNDEKQDDADLLTQNEESSRELLPIKKEEKLDSVSQSIESSEPSFEPEKGAVSSSNDQKEDMKSGEEVLKIEESSSVVEEKEPPIKKEEKLDSAGQSIESTKPSFEPEKGAVSSSDDQKEDMKSGEEVLKTEESSSVVEEKELNLTEDKETPHEPAALREESPESRMEKKEPSASPNY